MNFLLLTHNFPKSVKERKDAGGFVLDFAQELCKKGHEVFVLSPSFEKEKKMLYKNIHVEWFDWTGDGQKLGSWSLYSPKSLINFLKIIYFGANETILSCQKHDIDFILAFWAIPAAFWAFIAKIKTKIPYGVWALGSDIHKYSNIFVLKNLISLVVKKADYVFSNSFYLQKIIQKNFNKKVFFLPSATKAQKQTTKILKKTHFKNTKILFVGRLEKVKGIDILINAFQRLTDSKLKIKLNVLGDGLLKSEVLSKIKKYKLGKHIFLRGWASPARVVSYMRNSDYLVVPSRNESTPLVIIEAARNFLPVIANNVGDCGYIVKSYNVGYINHTNDAVGLSKTIIKAVKEKRNFSNGFIKLVSDYSIEVCVRKFLNYVKK